MASNSFAAGPRCACAPRASASQVVPVYYITFTLCSITGGGLFRDAPIFHELAT